MANWADKTCGYCGFVIEHNDAELTIMTCPVCEVDKCPVCGQATAEVPMCKSCAQQYLDQKVKMPQPDPE